jgi:hypothetical protein
MNACWRVQAVAVRHAFNRGDRGAVACTASMMQDATWRPSSGTVQAPQTPTLHASLVPVRPRS